MIKQIFILKLHDCLGGVYVGTYHNCLKRIADNHPCGVAKTNMTKKGTIATVFTNERRRKAALLALSAETKAKFGEAHPDLVYETITMQDGFVYYISAMEPDAKFSNTGLTCAQVAGKDAHFEAFKYQPERAIEAYNWAPEGRPVKVIKHDLNEFATRLRNAAKKETGIDVINLREAANALLWGDFHAVDYILWSYTDRCRRMEQTPVGAAIVLRNHFHYNKTH